MRTHVPVSWKEVDLQKDVQAARRSSEAGRFVIDTLKHSVPIWKKELFEGGA